jgi:hypothetical protein
MAKVMIGVRVEEETQHRIDVIAAELSRRAAGVEAKRGEVARAALERGVTALERELEIKQVAMPTKRTRPPGRTPSK